MPRAAAIGAVLAVAACGAPPAPGSTDEFADPLEGFNRTMHGVNVALDENILRPAAIAYDTVTPETIQHLIGNGIDMLEQPTYLANYLLQGEFDSALRVFGRIFVNAVAGGGLLDPATEFGLPSEPTDFGITLGKWGFAEGNYLVLPFFGPSTVRDFGASFVDRAFDPILYVGLFTNADAVAPTVTLLDTLDFRDRNADLIDDVLYNSPDSYVTQRSIYLQRRRALVAGETTEESLPDIFDEDTGG